MIIKVFSTGTSSGQSPVNYLLSNKDHTGKERDIAPEVLEGSPAITIDVINSISRKHKYLSGVIAFREHEKPTREQMASVIKSFKQTICPGLSPDRINSLFVLHREKGNVEIHFVVACVDLLSGKRLAPYIPGPLNLELYSKFVACTNHELGYSQVVPDPFATQLSAFKLKSAGTKDQLRKLNILKTTIHKAIVKGRINNRQEFCTFLTEELGVELTRQGKDYISVKLDGDKTAQRLKGEMFKIDANYPVMLEASRKSKVPVILTSTQYQQTKLRLNKLIEHRSSFNTKAYEIKKPMRLVKPDTPQTKTTTKGEVKMFNFTVMKRIVDDCMNQMTVINRSANSPVNIPNKKGFATKLASFRDSAIAAPSNGGPTSFDAVQEIRIALGAIGESITNAMGELANARTPEAIASGKTKLQALQMQRDRILAQLRMAELRHLNDSKPSKFKL